MKLRHGIQLVTMCSFQTSSSTAPQQPWAESNHKGDANMLRWEEDFAICVVYVVMLYLLRTTIVAWVSRYEQLWRFTVSAACVPCQALATTTQVRKVSCRSKDKESLYCLVKAGQTPGRSSFWRAATDMFRGEYGTHICELRSAFRSS